MRGPHWLLERGGSGWWGSGPGGPVRKVRILKSGPQSRQLGLRPQMSCASTVGESPRSVNPALSSLQAWDDLGKHHVRHVIEFTLNHGEYAGEPSAVSIFPVKRDSSFDSYVSAPFPMMKGKKKNEVKRIVTTWVVDTIEEVIRKCTMLTDVEKDALCAQKTKMDKHYPGWMVTDTIERCKHGYVNDLLGWYSESNLKHLKEGESFRPSPHSPGDDKYEWFRVAFRFAWPSEEAQEKYQQDLARHERWREQALAERQERFEQAQKRARDRKAEEAQTAKRVCDASTQTERTNDASTQTDE